MFFIEHVLIFHDSVFLPTECHLLLCISVYYIPTLLQLTDFYNRDTVCFLVGRSSISKQLLDEFAFYLASLTSHKIVLFE